MWCVATTAHHNRNPNLPHSHHQSLRIPTPSQVLTPGWVAAAGMPFYDIDITVPIALDMLVFILTIGYALCRLAFARNGRTSKASIKVVIEVPIEVAIKKGIVATAEVLI